MPGQHSSLNFEHPAVGHLVAENGMRHFYRLAPFVDFEKGLAARIGELA